jgi:hypothetical protein
MERKKNGALKALRNIREKRGVERVKPVAFRG